MANQIPAFVEFPSHTMTITWGNRQLRLQFIWRERLNAWYFSLFEPASGVVTDPVAVGDPIVTGRRVTPRWIPLFGLIPVGLPLDVFPIVDGGIGSDPYRRADLGGGPDDPIRLLLLDEDEFPPAPDPDLAAGDIVITFP